jgi:hypothetical protein
VSERPNSPNGGTSDQHDRAVALAALALTGDRPATCPPLDELQRWHEGRLDAAQARAMQAHVGACDRCFELWRGLGALAEGDPRRRARASSAASGRLWSAIAALARSRTFLAGFATSVAMVAIVGVWFASLRPGAHGPPLPGYELELQGRALFRGAVEPPQGPVEFERGTHFELVLRPEHSVTEEIAAHAWIEHGGETRSLEAPPQLVARGVVVYAGEIGREWVLPPGDSLLIVVVGRAAALPEVATLSARLREANRIAEGDWTAWRIPVRVVDEPARHE